MAMKSIKKLSHKEIWEQLRQLREALQNAESAYYMMLGQIENERIDFWNPGKLEGFSFDNWLETHHPITPHSAVYRSFLKGSTEVGGDLDTVADMGVHATAELGRFKQLSKAALAEYVTRCKNFRNVHGTAPSEESARAWRHQLDDGHEPRVNTSATKIARLELELRSVRAELRKKEADLKAAKAEIERLKKGGRGKGASARAD
jgi:hypothetical protein